MTSANSAGAGGNIGERVALMMMKAANQQRAYARQNKRDASVAEDVAQRAEIAKLREKASDELLGGLMAAGAKLGAAGTMFGDAGAEGRFAQRAWGAGGKIAEAADAGVTGIFKAQSTTHEAEAREAANAASRAKRSLEEANDLTRDCRADARTALDLYKEFTAAHSQMQKAALHRA